MVVVKSAVGIFIFLLALYLFLAGPEQREEALRLVGASLEYRTVTGLSIVGMAFGVVFTLRTIFESMFGNRRVGTRA